MMICHRLRDAFNIGRDGENTLKIQCFLTILTTDRYFHWVYSQVGFLYQDVFRVEFDSFGVILIVQGIMVFLCDQTIFPLRIRRVNSGRPDIVRNYC